jgi:transposase
LAYLRRRKLTHAADPVNRLAIAQALGVWPKTVYGALARLRDQGLITAKARKAGGRHSALLLKLLKHVEALPRAADGAVELHSLRLARAWKVDRTRLYGPIRRLREH